MSDSLFVVGVFAFVFIVWLVGGGPTRPLSMAGPIIYGTSPTLPLAEGITSYGNPSSMAANTPQANTAVVGVNVNPDTGERTMPMFGTPSPYRGMVTLSHAVSGAGSTNPDQEYLTLGVASDGTPVDISGWKLESEATGVSATIPEGTTVPQSGIVNAVQPIVLQPGDTAIISSGRSPIGASFRENMCIGYFGEYQSFEPTLPRTCPDPYTELQHYYNGIYVRDAACINYVKSLNRCDLVATPPVNLTTTCDEFLTNYLNYNGCVTAHQHDSDFAGTTWRIYLNRNKSMWRKEYEVVKLLDKNGKTVDMFSY